MTIYRLLLVLLLAVVFGDESSAQEPSPDGRYFLTVFGTQSVPYRLRYTHTWAVYTRTARTAAGEVVVDSRTISWMPATLRVRPLALRTEPGANLTLDQSFDFAASFGGRVSVWGPYEIDAEHYANLNHRQQALESGDILYRAIGAFARSAAISNCGQSFARVSPGVGTRYLQPTPSAGENGSSRLVQRYLRAGVLADGGRVHDWLLPAIVGDRTDFTRRQPGERVPYFGGR